jgi:two-component system sensor histidine kinase GlrK
MKLTILDRLLMGYLAIFILVIGMSIYAIVRIGQFNEVMHTVLMTNNRLLAVAGKMTDTLLSQISFEKKFLITKDEAFHNQFLKLQNDFNQSLEQAMSVTDFSEPRVFLEGIKGSRASYQSLFQEEVNYLRTGHPYAQQWYQSEKEKASNGVLEALDQLKGYSQHNTGDKIQNLYESGTDARRMVIILTGAFLVLCVAISFVINRSIIHPISTMKKKTGEIAKGVFKGDLNLVSPPEIADLANAFNLMCNRLNELDRMKSDFFSSMSHELRTPLSTIKMGVGLLSEGLEGPVTEKQKKLLTILEEETNRLIGLVNSLLDLAKMEAGMMTYSLEHRQLVPLVDQAIKEIAPLVEAKKISLEKHIARELPVLKIDAERVLQALRNLIGNAVKFTPQGGQVSVSARSVDQGVEVSVSDTGPGIPKENLSTIFDKFQQGPSKGPSYMKGTGLGLAIAKQIIAYHGGKIWAESEPGCGSTFFFVLPA